MTSSENAVTRIRPVGPSTKRVKPLPCGMRSFIFCRAVFSSAFGSTNDSLMWDGPSSFVVCHASMQLTGRQTTKCDRLSHLPAAGTGVEVQIDGIAGQRDADKVADIDSEAFSRAHDLHVVCHYGKIQFAGSFQDDLAERFIGLFLTVRTTCNFLHVGLELEVIGVNRGEKGAETEQCGEHQHGGGDTPSGNGVHERSDSLPGAHSSAQISSEFGVHSAAERPEMWRSSSRRVPWPYGQMYSIRGRPNNRMRLQEPVATGMRRRRRHTRQR